MAQKGFFKTATSNGNDYLDIKGPQTAQRAKGSMQKFLSLVGWFVFSSVFLTACGGGANDAGEESVRQTASIDQPTTTSSGDDTSGSNSDGNNTQPSTPQPEPSVSEPAPSGQEPSASGQQPSMPGQQPPASEPAASEPLPSTPAAPAPPVSEEPAPSTPEPTQPGDNAPGTGDPEPAQPSPLPEPVVASFKAQLSWTAPATRENGSALMAFELGGYEIRYKLSSENSYTNITISNGQASSYILEGLSPGSYDFQISAYDVDGVYSTYASYTNVTVGS